MNGTRTIGIALAGAALLWVGTAAQQEVRDRPGFGSGTMDVRVVNHPAVTATQNGLWRVSLADTADVRIANTPTVATAAPSFVEQGRSYGVSWPSGRAETVSVVSLGTNGWVEVKNGNRRRWINLNNAEGIEESR